MVEAMECYTVRLPRNIKKLIRILAVDNECTQQELITRLIKKEVAKVKI